MQLLHKFCACYMSVLMEKHKNMNKQAGAELGQAQVKLEVIV